MADKKQIGKIVLATALIGGAGYLAFRLIKGARANKRDRLLDELASEARAEGHKVPPPPKEGSSSPSCGYSKKKIQFIQEYILANGGEKAAEAIRTTGGADGIAGSGTMRALKAMWGSSITNRCAMLGMTLTQAYGNAGWRAKGISRGIFSSKGSEPPKDTQKPSTDPRRDQAKADCMDIANRLASVGSPLWNMFYKNCLEKKGYYQKDQKACQTLASSNHQIGTSKWKSLYDSCMSQKGWDA